MSYTFPLSNHVLKNSFDLLDYNQEGKIDIQAVLENLQKLGYEKTHPEIVNLIGSLGEGKIDFENFVTIISNIMNEKEDEAGLQRMYDLLVYNPNVQSIDFETLKRISQEMGNPLTDLEIQFALNEAGDGKTVPIESFIKFMKSN